MPELLGGLYSFGNRAKRQLRDLLSNPAAYLEQSAEKLRDEAGRPTSARRVAERTFNPSEADIERASAWWNPSPLGAMAGVIKQKGGNWLAGSVEDALRGLKRPLGEAHNRAVFTEEMLSDPRIAEEVARRDKELSINRWIEGPLTKYVKTRMASPEDEVRRLAEQGVLHYDIAPGTAGRYKKLASDNRSELGFERKGVGVSSLAKKWETIADAAVSSRPASFYDAYTQPGENSWRGLVPENTPIYGMNRGLSATRTGPEVLGFPHLIDELSNALDPASGLPRHLQLAPEAMQNLSMEKAVRRVHDINEWRAAQRAELNRQMAEKASLVREYPENNPKGLRWVELKRNEQLPEFEYRQSPAGTWSILSKNGKVLGSGASKEDALYVAQRDAGSQELADQLKYEGDVMQNCVGGYCEDVLSGRSRIFSLRDAKGEPHVTVEVEPPGYESLPAEVRHQLNRADLEGGDWKAWVSQNYPDLTLAPRVKQIKGKQNKAPNPEYLPFVQDFVRNSPLGGPWSDVGDLANTGLLANKLHPSGFITREELEAAAKTPPEGYAPEDFIWPERYASGGRVTPITIRPGTETATTGTRGRSWDILSE